MVNILTTVNSSNVVEVTVSKPVIEIFTGLSNNQSADVLIDPSADNRIEKKSTGLFVAPVAEGDMIDMSLIFENALV